MTSMLLFDQRSISCALEGDNSSKNLQRDTLRDIGAVALFDRIRLWTLQEWDDFEQNAETIETIEENCGDGQTGAVMERMGKRRRHRLILFRSNSELHC